MLLCQIDAVAATTARTKTIIGKTREVFPKPSSLPFACPRTLNVVRCAKTMTSAIARLRTANPVREGAALWPELSGVVAEVSVRCNHEFEFAPF